VIFEACAIHPVDGSYSRIDVLRKIPDSDEWDLIEVKSSTEVKGYHYDDMSFQYYVFYHAGYKIRSCYMMLLDNQYIRDGDIDPQALFYLEDISEEVFALQGGLEHTVPQLARLPDQPKEPTEKIGARCLKPHECEYLHHCWAHVPEYSVFDVYHTKKKAEEVAEYSNSYAIEGISPDMLPTGLKAIDVECIHDNVMEYIETNILGDFLQGFEYPLYYLDYETVKGAIPLYDGTRPHQQIPFQFSLHVAETPDAELQHFEFLHKERSDPRQHFAERLLELCGEDGSVVVYNQTFEKRMNKEIARDFPQYASGLEAINERVVDLMAPFQKRMIYSPKQKSSHSIKAVLPAWTDLSYEDIEISGGGDAMELYFQFAKGTMPEDQHEKLWENLSAYCKLDTYGMVELLNVLKSRV
jgi:hypothetical protein